MPEQSSQQENNKSRRRYGFICVSNIQQMCHFVMGEEWINYSINDTGLIGIQFGEKKKTFRPLPHNIYQLNSI